MSSRIVLTGFTEFKAALRALPQELASEAGTIVNAAATGMVGDLQNAYPSVTGNLRRGIKVEHVSGSALGVIARVKNTARHSHLYEFGSQLRYTKSGAARGAMPEPVHPVFIPAAVRRRKQMYDALLALVRRAGFQVNG